MSITSGFSAALVVALAVGLNAQSSAPARGATGPAASAASKAPAPIATAFKTAYPNATIKNVSKETENGQVQYEVESVDKGRTRDLIYLADGSVVSLEEELTAAEFPQPVAAAIAKRYPTAKITRRERLTITKGHVVQYEAGLSGAKVKEAILTADGTWVSPK